jgi:hypothetical protein
VIQHAMARDPAVRIKSAAELDAQLAVFDRLGGGPNGDRGNTERSSTIAIPRSPVTPTGMPAQEPPAGPPSAEIAAQDIAVRAKLARPLAAFVAGASFVALAAWLAAILAIIVDPVSTGEHALIAIVALGCGGALAAFHIKTLQPRWRSGPAVTRHVLPYGRALVWSAVVLGALELLAHGTTAVFSGALLGAPIRLAITGAVSVLALGWRAWKLDEKLRSKIG